MGQVIGPWWTKHRTLVFALVLTAALAVAVETGHYGAARAVFPLAVVWGLAFHSLDFRLLVERAEAIFSAANRARQELRAGDVGDAVIDAGTAAQIVVTTAKEVEVEIHG